ncbi:hypothetical protein J7438_03805 [Thalassotalea sp. G20_0]|uniref:hypothetical protein n=1 Tax=Thalassotalea sp. G20_0 TaxID=2821093 RepID=UPI001ADB344D|nr:hypothetical protein [Thalassotalea sp. G20_0]MBO9493216.1 hypothetical protein [Thalassotalea sp. G20_0]
MVGSQARKVGHRFRGMEAEDPNMEEDPDIKKEGPGIVAGEQWLLIQHLVPENQRFLRDPGWYADGHREHVTYVAYWDLVNLRSIQSNSLVLDDQNQWVIDMRLMRKEAVVIVDRLPAGY